jgi:hypothetical protein
VSHKFSIQAQHWATIEQEAFAIFYSVQKLSYYLLGKDFVIETDHNNLLWMEASTVPKIIRWRIYLQTYNFKIRHISGKKNLVADWLSRLYDEDTDIYEVHHLRQLCTDELDDVMSTLHPFLISQRSYSSPIFLNAVSSVSSGTKTLPTITQLDAFHSVHNAKVGHVGTKLTWSRLNKHYPGHSLSKPIFFFQEFFFLVLEKSAFSENKVIKFK